MLSVVDRLCSGVRLSGAAAVPAADGTGFAVAFAFDVVALVACGAFVHAGGGVVARRDIAGRHPVPANVLARAVRGAARLLVPSLLVGLWTLSVAAVVLVLAPWFDILAVALVAISIAAAVRGAAHYSEGFAETLATMLPVSLLGLVVLDGVALRSAVTVGDVLTRLLDHWPVAMYGLVALVLVEAALRVAGAALRRSRDT